MHKILFIPIILLITAIAPNATADDLSDSANLKLKLDNIRQTYKIPGMAAAVITQGEIKSLAVSGVRKYGKKTKVQPTDAFQIGSITKAITATLAHVLDEKQILPINSSLKDVFPELLGTMRPEYQNVTIKMLLSHLAALPYMPSQEGSDEFLSISSNLITRRYEYVKAALQDAPEGTVGKHYVYSGGTIIVAAMMERKTGKSWGHLVRKYVLNPLDMDSAGFGAMSLPDRINGIWEHQLINGRPTPIPAPLNYDSEPHAPAGRNLHVAVGDLAKFLIANFPYSTDHRRVLARQSLLNMQLKSSYASTSPGWFVDYNSWSDWKTVYHNGDNGKSIATLVFSPKYEAGYVILANIAGDKAWAGVNKLSKSIEDYFENTLTNLPNKPQMQLAASSLTNGKAVTASNIFQEMSEYGPSMALDGDYTTRWATDFGVHFSWLEVDLGEPQSISTIVVKEEFAPRITSMVVKARSDEASAYSVIAKTRKVGDELVLHPTPFIARFVRLEFKTPGDAGPTISEFELFSERINSIY